MKPDSSFSVIVVGGGHAGCEAALAAARLGVPTLLLTMDLSTIGLMPCNPSIGGPGKGHLVREIGALGGEMARIIDETALQMKWLNTSKGPAVQARRAQADKSRYRCRLFETVFSTPGLTVRQGHVTEILVERHGVNRIQGVRLETGITFLCERVILATGTYLEGRIIVGRRSRAGGPHNTRAAIGLSDSLREYGIPLRRLQTATPPRIHRSGVDLTKVRELPGDPECGGFLWENRNRRFDNQMSCLLTFTNEAVIEAVRANLKDSPLVLANITNVGPKHCPSIDRKVLKFPNQVQHQIFIEPEGADTPEMYLQGLTTSMPPEAQRAILKAVPGLEHAEIMRYGYAIEYDALAPLSIHKTMASRHLEGLYTAGQINGTSGYEEAAAQGLISGLNAALSVLGRPPCLPSRTHGYIGVLIDDLSGWDHPEPYRITPAHAEFRLNLREQTAEARLSELGYQCGLVSEERRNAIATWLGRITDEEQRLVHHAVAPSPSLRERLTATGTGDLKKQVSAFEILQRPGITYTDLPGLLGGEFTPALKNQDEIAFLETEAHYRGYADREREQMSQTRHLESLRLPLNIPEAVRGALSADTQKLVTGIEYDDLAQPSRKHCLSKGDLAILLSSLSKHQDVSDAANKEKTRPDSSES
ncbi:MAG: tRNA uridine-5-carboxymethylaminomethyl(34) synthesis enzyme MnmG [Candidatus Ozemobacteraceae bacterium]